jgi:hypothetical protein
MAMSCMLAAIVCYLLERTKHARSGTPAVEDSESRAGRFPGTWVAAQGLILS